MFLSSILLLSSPAFPLNPHRSIGQLYHTAWTAKEAAPSQIRALAQTTDGFLWLGTSSGLYRFDGVIFERYEIPSSIVFPTNNIYSLLATPDGGLWIGFWYGGVSFLNGRGINNFGTAEGLPPGKIQSLARDHEGTIWAAASGGLARLRGDGWESIGADWQYPGKAAQSVFVDKAGTLWVATEETIVFLPKGTRSFQTTGEHVLQVLQMAQDATGAIWVAETSRSIRPIFVSGAEPRSIGPEIRVGSVGILFDRKGSLWATSLGDGIRRLKDPGHFRGRIVARFGVESEIFRETDGLSGDYSTAILEDREGNIWIGTANGLDRFRESYLVPVRFPSGYQDFGLAAGERGEIWTGSSNQGANRVRDDVPKYVDPKFGISFVFREREGTIWMAGTVGLYRLRGDECIRIDMPIGPKILGVSAIFKDRSGALWVYLDREGAFLLKDGVWTRYRQQAELPEGSPITGSIDSKDRKWFGYPGNTLAQIDGENIRTFSEDDGLTVGDIKSIHQGPRNIWVGGTLGVALLNGDGFQTLLTGGNESFRGVSGIVETEDGALWLNAGDGVINVPASEIKLATDDPLHKVYYRRFDFLDGLPGTAQQNRPFPTAVEGTDGRLWFASNKGIAWVDPDNLSKNYIPPPVAIRSLITDENTYLPSQLIQLAKGTTSFRITYTALSLAMPERVRFRYRLEGVDLDWQEAGTRREAFYTNLGPGSYRFQVIAANNDGVWNEEGAVLEFKILPIFYQTYWFLLICLAALACLIWVAYQFRVRQLQGRMQMQFDERLSERTRIARDLHDNLMQGVVSAAMQLDVATEFVGESSPAKPMLVHINRLMTNVVGEGRNALKGLRSPTVNYLADLEQRLSEIRQELNPEGTIDFRTTVAGEPRPLLSAVGEEAHQICREALTNAFRHSVATVIEVELEYTASQFRIVVRDNGRGIDPELISSGREGHFGLSGMRERSDNIGGLFKVYSRVEGGTEVELSIPGRLAFEPKFSNMGSRWLSFINRRQTRSGKERGSE